MAQTAAGAALRHSREQKLLSWFSGRHWRVCAEITGNREKDGFRISYFRGYFQVTAPAVFQTPFGRIALERASESFRTVTGLPERDPRRHGAAWLS